MADFLTIDDLIARVGSRKVIGYFDDSNNGTLSDESTAIDVVLSAAEAELYARLLRAYPGDPADPAGAMQQLIANDPALKIHVVGVALQYAAERRPEFTDVEGVGPYKAQWDRAMTYFELLSKGQQRSRGEVQAGQGANSGGTISPRPPAATEAAFVFARNRNSPTGHGGFVIPLSLALGEILRAMLLQIHGGF